MNDLLKIPAEWKWSHTIPIFRALDENGEWILEGMGGDDEPEEIYNTRVSLACMRDMKEQIVNKEISLLRSHWDEQGKSVRRAKWFESMGDVVDMLITPEAQFFPRIILDKSDKYAQKLFTAIQRGKKMGLSFGGGEVETHMETYRDGRIVKVFDKLDLWHFVPTTAPVYTRNLNSPLAVISRSVDWNSAENRTTEKDEYSDGYPDREKVYAIYREVKEQKEQDLKNNDDTKGDDTPMFSKEDMEALGGVFRSALTDFGKELTTSISANTKEVLREMIPETPAPAAPETPAAPEPAPAPAPEPAPAPAAPAAPAAPDAEEIARSIKDAVAEAMKSVIPEVKAALKGGAPAGDPAAPGDGKDAVMREIQEVLTGKKARKEVTNPEVLRAVDALCVTALNSQLGTDTAQFRSFQ